MHDFLTWPNRYLQKSTPAVGEPAFHALTSPNTSGGLTAALRFLTKFIISYEGHFNIQYVM